MKADPDVPFFSIIIPTYNRGHLIMATLDSVVRQTFTAFEVIVVDDGSSDDTEAVVTRLEHDKIRYVKKQNGERGAARNFGWRMAKGTYVTFLDSDDVFYPAHLQTAFDKLRQLAYPNCYAQAFEIKEEATGLVIWKGYRSKESVVNEDVLKGNFLACFGVFLKRELMADVLFKEERDFAGTEDWLLWLQLAARHPFYFSNEVTGTLTHHRGRSVLSMNKASLLFRPDFLKEQLEQDSAFMKTFGSSGIRRAYAHVLSYVALGLADGDKTGLAISYLWKTAKASPKELMRKRTLGIIKTILLRKVKRSLKS